MQKELSDRTGAYNYTISDDATKLKRWLNMAQQYICGKRNWPFMIATEIVQTVTDITTGTVSISASDTALTFSSAPSVSVANRYIQLSTSDDWYLITAHTAASTSATISPAYVGTSALSAGTYKVRKLLYGTSSSAPLDSYLEIKKTVNPGRLESISRREGEFFLPLYLEAGNPTTYIMGPTDSSGNLQFSLANPPDAIINLLVRGIKKLSDLSADSDTSIIPTRWDSAMIDIGAHYAFVGLDDTRAKTELERGELKVSDMAKVFDTDLGRHRVMASVDGGGLDYFPVYTLPPYYGQQYNP